MSKERDTRQETELGGLSVNTLAASNFSSIVLLYPKQIGGAKGFFFFPFRFYETRFLYITVLTVLELTL